jgi:hypothetical protein
MTARRTDRATSWSVLTYRLILQVYPYSFRREFGESMTQVFTDSVRAAGSRARLTTLWMRTIVDVVNSLLNAYLSETRDSMFRLATVVGVFYFCALAGVVGYGAIRFGEFYQPPGFSVFGAPNVHEDMLRTMYEQALNGEFGRYRLFTIAAGFSLAALLGATSALFGLWQKSLPHGAGALIAGTALTILAFELLPTVWFPLDRYPVGALWLMGGGLPLAACAWLLVVALGRFGPARARFTN